MNTPLVRVKFKVIEDDTGRKRELPCLLGEEGILTPLLFYLIERQGDGFSFTSIDRTVRAVHRFLDYLEVNKNSLSDPKLLFQTFVKRAYEGTIGDDGIDESGLYWFPATADTTRHNLSSLKSFLDWMIDLEDLRNPPSLSQTPSPKDFLLYAAWFSENRYDFIGRTKYRVRNGKREEFKAIRGGTRLSHRSEDPLEFPEKDFQLFFNKGIGVSNDFRSALRDKLIVLLMHGGGLRESEALSLWVTDVFEDPDDPECALVRVYHPEEGRAPNNWRGRGGQTNRAAYLQQEFGLTPRNKLMGTQHLGWKGRKVDGADNFIQVHWFPKEYGKLFMTLWLDYMRVLAAFHRDHPYAFVAFRKQCFGDPYTLVSFNKRYARGLKNIGRYLNSAQGFSPHGHRHAYGRRLMRASVDPIIRQKCLHHSSLDSQKVYTSPSLADVGRSLKEAMQSLDLFDGSHSIQGSKISAIGENHEKNR